MIVFFNEFFDDIPFIAAAQFPSFGFKYLFLHLIIIIGFLIFFFKFKIAHKHAEK
jgi:hypothetical protein